jgi:hydrogenase nickel incorporation protein HypA/HybF
MHELSIADAIVQIALRHANGRPVSAVEVSVGHLRQVVPSSLEFAFELLCSGTPLEGARLELHEIAPRGRCRECDTESEWNDFPLRCAQCGALDIELLAGGELTVDALELDEPDRQEELTIEGMAHGG